MSAPAVTVSGTHAPASRKPGDVEPPAPAPAPPPAPAKSPWQTVLHEVFTVILGGSILILTLWMIARTFSMGAEPFSGDDKQVTSKKDAYERQKDLMLYGLSLLGTVTGYYLGRVPAERRADSAQKSADRAEGAAKVAQDDAAGARVRAKEANSQKESAKAVGQDLVRQAKAALAAAKGGGPTRATLAGSGGGSPPAPADLSALEGAVDRMEQMLSSIT